MWKLSVENTLTGNVIIKLWKLKIKQKRFHKIRTNSLHYKRSSQLVKFCLFSSYSFRHPVLFEIIQKSAVKREWKISQSFLPGDFNVLLSVFLITSNFHFSIYHCSKVNKKRSWAKRFANIEEILVISRQVVLNKSCSWLTLSVISEKWGLLPIHQAF